MHANSAAAGAHRPLHPNPTRHRDVPAALAAMVLTEARARDNARQPCGASFLATERLAASTAGAGLHGIRLTNFAI